MDVLDNSDDPTSPVLQDYPMDYEILEEGDYFIEPTDENDLYHSIYTVIPINYQLPNSLPFQTIEELYYPEDENEYDVETVALHFADRREDLEADDIFVTDETLLKHLIDSYNIHQSNKLFVRKFRPAGTINVENTDDATPDPLMQAKISTGRSFWWRYTYTDDNGNFTATKRYRGKVRIRAKWRGYTATIKKT